MFLAGRFFGLLEVPLLSVFRVSILRSDLNPVDFRWPLRVGHGQLSIKPLLPVIPDDVRSALSRKNKIVPAVAVKVVNANL